MLLAQAGCGYLGLELLDLPGGSGASDGGASDGGPAAEGGADASPMPGGDASSTGDAAGAADGGEAGMSDGGGAGSPDGSTPADAAIAPSDAMTVTPCDMTGTFAIKVTLAVTWSGGAITGGSDVARIWARFVGTQAGNNLTGTFQACGFILPDYALNPLLATEKYQLAFPDTLFDHLPPYIAGIPQTLSGSQAFGVGSAFTFPTLTIQVGAALSNPSSDPWPAATAVPTVDTDADGKPAVTSFYSNAAGYSYQRLDGNTTPERADRTYGAARFTLNATGTVSSCTRMAGDSNFPNFDTHIVGCHVVGESDCTSAQRDMLDNGRPAYVSGSSSIQLLKIAAGATCADVRSALP